MAGPTTPDPASLFREMLGQWEAMANEFGANMLKSGEFTRVMHGANAANMKFKEARTDLMERALDAANMPSKADVADMSSRLARIEGAVERIEAMLIAQAGVQAGGSRAAPERSKPARTRKPPSSGPAKATG